MADNFDKWHPTSDAGRKYKAFQKTMENQYNDPNSGFDKNCDLNSAFKLVRLVFDLFGGKK